MDTISDMIVQVKNAGNAGRDRVLVPYSKLKHSIAEVLKRENFIKDVETEAKKGRKILAINLIFEGSRLSFGWQAPKIKGVKRISKLSQRIYQKAANIRAVKNGYGALILSTSRGIMSDREARRAKLGGEALFQIW